jgi:hypothetical protein
VGVTGYRLYLGANQVGTAPSTSYLFSGLTCGTSYTLGVAAVDAAGNVSGTATSSATTAVCSGSGGGNFSGTFDCYGSTPNCTDTPAACTSTISSGIAAAVSAAAAGSVICLKAGSYPATTLSSVSKSSKVTVRPADGATVRLGATSLNGTTNHIRFSGTGGTMNMAGVHFARGNTNDTLDHIVFTDCADVKLGSSSSNLLMDHDRFQNVGKEQSPSLPICDSLSEGHIQIEGSGTTSGVVVFKVTNTLLSGGCGDGVQVGTAGAQIGPGNEFTNIVQGGCNAHSDGVQCVGSPGLVLVGNYFHDNGDGSGGLMCGAGFSNFHETNIHVVNNVFASDAYYGSVEGAAHVNDIVSHNYMRMQLCWGYQNGNAPSGNNAHDNAFQNSPGITMACDDGGTCPTCTATYNLNPGASWFGTGSVNGTPIFVGGSHPTSYYGYELASNSPGYHAGSDGKSMGIAP